MKIAVFGWYGHDNAGDERIKYCLAHFLKKLGGVQSIEFFDLHENAIKGKTKKFDNFDLIIIGGGGLILSQHNYHDFIAGLGAKIVTAGISVETDLIGNPKKFAEVLLEKSIAFLVRDIASFAKLAHLDKKKIVKVSADLTFLEPYEVCQAATENIIGVNLLAKTVLPAKYIKYLLWLNKLKVNYNPSIQCYMHIIQALKKEFSLSPIPLYCAAQPENIPDYMLNDVNILKKYFSQLPRSFQDKDIEVCQIFFSMRLHGLIFAVQKGVIPFTMATYPKQFNFMKMIGLAEGIIGFSEHNIINNKMHALLTRKDSIREKILHYRQEASERIKNDVIEVLNLIK